MNRPPARPLQATLPFGDLTDEQFENAVRELMRASGFENVEFKGDRGDRQGGVDITGDLETNHFGVSVKRYGQFRYGDADEAITAATYTADRYVLALSRKATVGVQKAIAEHSDSWELWDRVRLSDMVRDLPHDIAVDYVERHFHHAHVETFLGRPRASAFAQREVYFSPFADVKNLRYHGLERVGPPAPLDALRTFIRSPVARVAIISGPVGIGKSKLLHDFSALEDNMDSRQSYFLLPGAQISTDALREIRSTRSVVLVEDAGDVPSLGHLLHHSQTVDAKIVLAASSADAFVLRERLLELGFARDAIVDLRLDRLRRADTIELVRRVLGRELPLVENAIVMQASESPLSTILAARVIRDRSDAPQTAIEARELTRALFGDVLAGTVSIDIPREDAKAVLQLVAATSPARLEGDEWLQSGLRFLGWDDQERLLRVLDALDDSGVLARRGGLYYAPEFVRQQIVREACVIRNRASSFPTRLYEAFGINCNVLRNVGIADVEITAAGGPLVFDDMWRKISIDACAAHSLQRAVVLDALVDVAYVKPREVLELVEYLGDHPATNDEEQPFAEIFGRLDHEAVLRHFPRVLQAVMSANPSYIPAVMRRLWRIGKDKARVTGSPDPLGVIKGFTTYGSGFDGEKALQVVRGVAELISNGESDTPIHSLLELVTPLLARDVSNFVPRGVNFELRRFVLDVPRMEALRGEAIALIVAAALDADGRRADQAIEALCDLLREPEHLIVDPNPEDVAAWDRERALAFDAFETVVASGEYPLRELRIATKLQWFSQRSPSEFVRLRAQSILDSLIASGDRDRYRILVPEFLRPELFVERFSASNFKRASQAQSELVSRTVNGWLAAIPDARAFLDDLASRLEATRLSGLAVTERNVFNALAFEHLTVAHNVLETILENGDRRFSGLAPIVASIFAADLGQGEQIAERLLRKGDPELAISLAEGLDPDLGDDAAPVQARFLRRLLTHFDLDVRRVAARTLMFFCDRHKSYGIDLVLIAEIKEDSKLADEIYMALGSSELPNDYRLKALVEKLRLVARLEYWPLYQLGRIAQMDPESVFELFAWRVEYGSDNLGYSPLPYVDHELEGVFRIVAGSRWFLHYGVQRLRDLRRNSPEARHSYVEQLYAAYGKVSPEILKAEIIDGLSSDDPAEQQMALGLLKAASHAAIADDIEFIVRTAERAVVLGSETARCFKAALIGSLTSGAENNAPYEPSASDLRVQNVAAAALERTNNPTVQRLFEELRDWGHRSAERTIQRAEEHLGPS